MEEFQAMGKAVFEGYESGWLNPIINKEFDMEDIQKVFSLELTNDEAV